MLLPPRRARWKAIMIKHPIRMPSALCGWWQHLATRYVTRRNPHATELARWRATFSSQNKLVTNPPLKTNQIAKRSPSIAPLSVGARPIRKGSKRPLAGSATELPARSTRNHARRVCPTKLQNKEDLLAHICYEVANYRTTTAIAVSPYRGHPSW